MLYRTTLKDDRIRVRFIDTKHCTRVINKETAPVPYVKPLAEDFDAVKVCDGTVDCILIAHLHQGCPRHALHEFHL